MISKFRTFAFVAVSIFIFGSLSISGIVGCGGGGDSNTTSGGSTPTGQPSATPSTSYFPLTKGLKTTFQDGVTIDANSGAKTSGITAEILDGGVVRISGKLTFSSEAPIKITEELTFKETGNSLSLTKDYVVYETEDGSKSSHVTTSFSPAVVILPDINNITAGAESATEHVSVTYEGDVTDFHFSPSTSVPANKTDTKLTVEISEEVKTIVLNGVSYPAYWVIMGEPSRPSLTPWFNNLFGCTWWGGFQLAKGIGIVRIFGAPAVSTNVVP